MGFFISFEGPEGSGKSTQAELLGKYLREEGHDVVMTREPGGSPIGNQIREILLDPDNDEMDSLTELFLYEAARRQHVTETIEPALKQGSTVISDRFSDASLIYQGVSRDIPTVQVEELNSIATGGLKPDLTFILDVSAPVGLKKARKRSEHEDGSADRIEQEDVAFHERVREAYLDLAEKEPERCHLIERNGTIEEIHETIRDICESRLESNAN